MTATRADAGRRTGEILELVLALADEAGEHLAAGLHELSLSRRQANALIHLSAERPMPMRELARRLRCDASNVTGLSDRLIARGLVERRPDPMDRRVRGLVITAEGERVRRLLAERLTTASPRLGTLTDDEQAHLQALLRRAVEEPAPPHV